MYDELTEVDIKKMQEEIDHRILVLRPQYIKDVQEARAFGDLSENFEYKEAKRQKNRNESRIRYLQRMIRTARVVKTDHAEAETLTGEKNRVRAAKMLASWGAKEVMLTHHTEVLVWADGEIHAAPFTARNLSGRTGRGDTCFASYCYWRQNHSAEEACRFAAAVTSRKMERPGPFTGTVADADE